MTTQWIDLVLYPEWSCTTCLPGSNILKAKAGWNFKSHGNALKDAVVSDIMGAPIIGS
jgi:hypothetical protein